MEHGVHGRVGKGGDVGGGGVRGDHVRAEGVDAALHHDVRDVENDGLKPRRKADLDHAERLVRMQADLPELELRRALLTHKADEDEHDGDILRNDGRNGDARNVQLTDDHEEQIQENVQHAGNGEEDERALRIAVGAEDGGGEIVDQRAGNADEIDAQIEAGQRQNVVRRVHPFEHRRGKEETEQERHHAQNEAQGDGAVDGTLDAHVVAAAGIARDQNVDADGNADERAGQKIDERRGRADGGQRRAAREFADDDDVRRVEQQLQNARQRQRQGKHQDLRQKRAVQHIKLVVFGHDDVRTPFQITLL